MKQCLKELGIFSAGLNRFLSRTGSSQAALARKVGATKVCVSQWSTGKCEPKVSSLAALIEEGITAEEIFGPDIARTLLNNTVEHPFNNTVKPAVEHPFNSASR